MPQDRRLTYSIERGFTRATLRLRTLYALFSFTARSSVRLALSASASHDKRHTTTKTRGRAAPPWSMDAQTHHGPWTDGLLSVLYPRRHSPHTSSGARHSQRPAKGLITPRCARAQGSNHTRHRRSVAHGSVPVCRCDLQAPCRYLYLCFFLSRRSRRLSPD